MKNDIVKYKEKYSLFFQFDKLENESDEKFKLRIAQKIIDNNYDGHSGRGITYHTPTLHKRKDKLIVSLVVSEDELLRDGITNFVSELPLNTFKTKEDIAKYYIKDE